MSAKMLEVLRHQRSRGPLPSSLEGLGGFIERLQQTLPEVRIELPTADPSALSRLRATGLAADLEDGSAVVRFPADGDALDRVLSLLGLPALQRGGAATVLAALEEAEDPARLAPRVSLPLRIRPAKATALGWSKDLFSLTLLVSNVEVQRDGTLVGTGRGPIVAVCAEYERPLTSIDPPGIADYPFERAQALGVPMLRLERSWFRRPLRLEATHELARAPADRPEAVARASRFLGQLDDAWQRRIGAATEIAWPVFRPAHQGPLLDGVRGVPLPGIQLH